MTVINFETTASFDVDAQNGFTPICPNELPVVDGHNIVPELNHQAMLCKYRVGSKDWHHSKAAHIATEESPQFTPVIGYPNIDIKWNAHCIGSTYGAELLSGLPNPVDYDFFVWKGIEADLHPYGACFHDAADTKSTGVIEWMKSKGITTVIVGGLATDFCVLKTVKQLVKAGFYVIVNLGACRAINAPIKEKETTLTVAMKEMEDLSVEFVDSADYLSN